MGLEKHPSSEPLLEFIKNWKVAYKVLCKFIISACLKSFEIRPSVEKTIRDAAPLVRRLCGSAHVAFVNRVDGKVQCSLCLRACAKVMTGNRYSQLASSQMVWSAAHFTLCILCGAHSRIVMRRLGGQRALDRVRRGLHPTKDLFVGTPAPFLPCPQSVQAFEDEDVP